MNDSIRACFGTNTTPLTPLEIMCECGKCSDVYATTLGHYDSIRSAGFVVAHD